MSEMTRAIANLFAKSFVVTEVESGNARYRLLDTTRAYALEKLGESGEQDRIACRHAEYYQDLFEREETEQETRPTVEWLAEYRWQIDNLRAALDWAFSLGGNTLIGLRLTAAAVPLWMHLSLVAECRERCDRALLELQTNDELNTRLRMRLQIGLGNSLLHTRGPSEQAQTALAQALESAEALGDLRAQLRVLLDLASVIGFSGEYTRAAAASERARAIAQQIGDTTGVAFADRRMGMILLRTGRLAEAQRYFERVIQPPPFYQNEDQLAISRHSDERAMARALLARTLWLRGFPEMAHHEAQTSLGEVRGLGSSVDAPAGARGIWIAGAKVGVLTSVRPRMRPQLPRARMGVRGSAPYQDFVLSCTPNLSGFANPVSSTVAPYFPIALLLLRQPRAIV
jgi:tetratricopeptide (TPR) repeat protein